MDMKKGTPLRLEDLHTDQDFSDCLLERLSPVLELLNYASSKGWTLAYSLGQNGQTGKWGVIFINVTRNTYKAL